MLVIVLAVVLVLVLTGDDDTPAAADNAPTTGQDAGGDEPPLGQGGTDPGPPASGGATSTDIEEVAHALVAAMHTDDRQTLLAHTCTSRAEYFEDAIEHLHPAAAPGVPPEVAAVLEQVEASYEFEAAAVLSEVEAQAIFQQHLSDLPPQMAGFPTTARIVVRFVEENGWKMCDLRFLDDEEVPPAR